MEGRATFGGVFIERIYEEVNRPSGQRPKELYLKMGKRSRRCVRCGSTRRLIRKYGLYLCAKCFRELADEMGRKKTGIKR